MAKRRPDRGAEARSHAQRIRAQPWQHHRVKAGQRLGRRQVSAIFSGQCLATASTERFLRMHPTGKTVLSLSESSQGQEAMLAQTAADELGIPPEDVKVVHEDADRFGEGTASTAAQAARWPRTSRLPRASCARRPS